MNDKKVKCPLLTDSSRAFRALPERMGEFVMQFHEEYWDTPQDDHRCNLSPLPFPLEPLATHCEASYSRGTTFMLNNMHFYMLR